MTTSEKKSEKRWMRYNDDARREAWTGLSTTGIWAHVITPDMIGKTFVQAIDETLKGADTYEPGPDGCPFCGAGVPDNVALDQWGFFHCDDEECGARLRLDEQGRPYQRLAHLGIDIFKSRDESKENMA